MQPMTRPPAKTGMVGLRMAESTRTNRSGTSISTLTWQEPSRLSERTFTAERSTSPEA